MPALLEWWRGLWRMSELEREATMNALLGGSDDAR